MAGAWSYRFKVVVNNNNTKHLEINIKHSTTHPLWQGNMSNGNASNEHATDKNVPSKCPGNHTRHGSTTHLLLQVCGTTRSWTQIQMNPQPPTRRMNLANEDPPLAVLLGCMGAPGAPGLLEGLLGGPLIVLQGPPVADQAAQPQPQPQPPADQSKVRGPQGPLVSCHEITCGPQGPPPKNPPLD
ncbi:hypothetical protein BS47DRAFT_1364768 [Hydnum rufescens UP504]|uniref:Uncharacterized protein n=1 Tax=Hydnum rufescens UP504 TaxID=1448309 RepID=A0A9P6AQR4_9AGAM|nr:hypothetical protein BS47DRAFT_1364768 [Hydnum rufescens UP504]